MNRKFLILLVIVAMLSAFGVAMAASSDGANAVAAADDGRGGGGGNGGGNGNGNGNGNGGGNGNGTPNPPPDNPPCDADNHLVDLPKGLLDKCPSDGGPGTEGPPGDETCSDGIDNDEDGATDQEDSDCQEPEGPPGDETCSDGIDNDGDGATDEEDSDCQNGGGGAEPTCGDPDGDGVDHSAFDPDSNEGGLVSSIVHGVDQALPSPVGGDQGVVTEVNCAIVVTVEEILGING